MKAARHIHPSRARTRLVSAVAILLALTLGVATVGTAGRASATGRQGGPRPTVVLVHGAFADASSWHPVIERLARRGYDVIAPTNPLRGLEGDAQYLRDVLASVPGPIVLVGHSYGGFVVTNAATGDPDVRALVYVAAFAPDVGESIGSISASAPGSLLTPDRLSVRHYLGADGQHHLEGEIAAASYREVFAADVGRTEAATFAVSQKPADLSILGAPSGPPAWEGIPTWTLVATEDNVIPPEAQRAMAIRAGAVTSEVRASHSVAVSRAATVARFIEQAARAVS